MRAVPASDRASAGRKTRKVAPCAKVGLDSRSCRPGDRPARGHARGRCPRPADPARRSGGTGRRCGHGPCGSMPRPLSAISIDHARAARVGRARRSGPGRPGLRYLTAFSIRLDRICSTASRSLTIVGQRRLDRRSRRRARRSLVLQAVARRPPTSAAMSSRSGVSTRRPSRDRLQDGVDQPVHLLGRGADEADRFGQILARREPRVLGDDARAPRPRRVRSARRAAWSAASSSAVKPITLTSGERRSWLTI